ncbi:hypothetical protein GCM10009740_02340 [Terrabacter terrae]|uniref:Uncharacterized protein n=1 Tax=Terrabacter terrae TaxID=318434 RepID=A0ABN2TRN7_9MICO
MDALELIVDEGRPANAGRFFQLGADLLALLDELSDVPVAWRITELRTGSALATIAPPEGAPQESRWLRLVHSSLGRVGQGEPLPDEWTPDAVKTAHRFVEHGQPVDGGEDWVPPRLALVTDAPAVPPSVELTAALGERLEVLQPFERTMPGSVRGELVGLNVSRGNRASLRLPNKRIVRVGFDTSLRGELKDALYKQVEVSGAVRQDGDGRIFHIRAEDVRILVKPDLRWADLFGVDPDFTEGATTEEWLGVNRGQA